MRAALGIIDIIAESQYIFVEFVDELESGFHRDMVADPLIIDDVCHSVLGFVERANKPDDPIGFVKFQFFVRRLSLIGIEDRKFRVEIRRLVHAALDVLFPKAGLFKDLGIRQEIDPGTGPFGLALYRQQAVLELCNGISSLILVLIKKTAAANADGHPFRESIDHGRTYAVQSSAGLICLIIKFSAGMKSGEHHAFRAHTFLVHSDRYASAVVFHGAGPVLLQYDLDRGAVSCQMLVHGVIDNLIDQMIESSGGDTADVHSGSRADSFKSFQYLDAVRCIIGILIMICHANLLYDIDHML